MHIRQYNDDDAADDEEEEDGRHNDDDHRDNEDDGGRCDDDDDANDDGGSVSQSASPSPSLPPYACCLRAPSCAASMLARMLVPKVRQSYQAHQMYAS